jgi:tetratricopeptide (TPR) repeat protein
MELRHQYGLGGSHRSYAVALAVIGHFLVRERARGVLIAELSSGFFVTWHDSVSWEKVRHCTIDHDQILDQTGPVQGSLLKVEQAREPAKKHLFRRRPERFDLRPADFLQSIGIRLDRKRAVSIMIIETTGGYRIAYWVDKATFVIHGSFRMPISLQHDELVEHEEVQATITSEQARRRVDFDALEHTLRATPRDFPALVGVVANLEDELRYREAEELAADVATLVPEREEAHYHAARFALVRGDRTLAMERLQPALRLGQAAPEILDLQARLLWAEGKRNDALALWEALAQTDAPLPVHLQRYGRALAVLGRTEESTARMQEAGASTVAPTRDMALELLDADAAERNAAQVSPLRRPMDHALPSVRYETFEDDVLHPFLTGEGPTSDQARGPLSDRLLAANRHSEDQADEAREETKEEELARLQAELVNTPDDSSLLRKLGFAYARCGQLDAAAEAYRKAIEIDSRQ